MAAFGAATALSWSCYIQGTICPWWPRWGVIRDELQRFPWWKHWDFMDFTMNTGFFFSAFFFLARENQGI
jgi:hypothetical protein